MELVVTDSSKRTYSINRLLTTALKYDNVIFEELQQGVILCFAAGLVLFGPIVLWPGFSS